MEVELSPLNLKEDFQLLKSLTESERQNQPILLTSSEPFGRLLASGRGEAVEGFHGASDALIFASLLAQDPSLYIWCCRNNREAERVVQDVEFFLPPGQEHRVLFLPGIETSPYRGLSPHPEIAEQRAVALWKLLRGHQGLVITTLLSWVSHLLPPSIFLRYCIQLEVDKPVSLDAVLRDLHTLGYQREDPVSQMVSTLVEVGSLTFSHQIAATLFDLNFVAREWNRSENSIREHNARSSWSPTARLSHARSVGG